MTTYVHVVWQPQFFLIRSYFFLPLTKRPCNRHNLRNRFFQLPSGDAPHDELLLHPFDEKFRHRTTHILSSISDAFFHYRLWGSEANAEGLFRLCSS